MNISVITKTLSAFGEDKATRLASAIAYSTIFSITPLFIVLIALAGYILGIQNGGHGHHTAEDALLQHVESGMGKDAANTIRDMIANSFNKPRQNLLTQIAGWVTFLVGASALFSSLQDALNSVWQLESTGGGWKHMLRDRLASFGMLAVVGFLLIVSLVGTLAVGTFGTNAVSQLPFLHNAILVNVLSQMFTALIIMIVFSAMYKFLPAVQITWRDVIGGAFGTTILFMVGETLVTFYLHVAGVTSSYGAAGAILVALIWIYYTAIIFLLGAEYMKIQVKSAKTSVPTKVRLLTDQPAGIDPRNVSRSSSA
jgi:membrane protein